MYGCDVRGTVADGLLVIGCLHTQGSRPAGLGDPFPFPIPMLLDTGR